MADFEVVPVGTLKELEELKGGLSPDEVKDLKEEIKSVRLYAADNLPTDKALVIIHKLEKLMHRL